MLYARKADCDKRGQQPSERTERTTDHFNACLSKLVMGRVGQISDVMPDMASWNGKGGIFWRSKARNPTVSCASWKPFGCNDG
jgi:hypothetical protein